MTKSCDVCNFKQFRKKKQKCIQIDDGQTAGQINDRTIITKYQVSNLGSFITLILQIFWTFENVYRIKSRKIKQRSVLLIAQPAACSQMERWECSHIPLDVMSPHLPLQGLWVADHGLQWSSYLRTWVQPWGCGISPFWSSDNSCLSHLMQGPLLC